MMVLHFSLILASLFSSSLSQAPGDGSPLCLAGNPVFLPRPVYPANTRPLMDSRDYVNLLLGKDAVWQHVDIDSNNTPGVATNWFQLSASLCQGNVLVCGYTAGVQENWLITQHISRQLNSGQLFDRLSVHIEYELASCGVDCRRHFDLYKWETSGIDPDAARQTENYVQVGIFAPNSTQNDTGRIDVIFTTQESGLYLAFVDQGTCVVIERILVFYEGFVCSGNVIDLVQHPEVIPPQNDIEGSCIDNSSTPNGANPVLRCIDEGIWEVVSPCLCSIGFESTKVDDVISCTECTHGTFSDIVSNEPCLPCPDNSVIEATQSGLTAECPCIEGYFKAPTDGHTVPCTRSPSAPLDFTVSEVTNTSITLSWLQPEFDGGRNFSEIFYTLRIYNGDSLVATHNIGAKRTFIVTGLTPGAYYTFSVTAENAVSSQDTNINARTAIATATTFEGVPTRVREIQEHCTVVVWKQPTEKRGLLINYIVIFTRNNESRQVLTDAKYHYHVLEVGDIPPGFGNVTVEVRAQNELGLGPRPLEPVTIGCLNEHPTQAPEPCPEEPPCLLCPSPSCPPPLTCLPCPSPVDHLPCPNCPPCPTLTLSQLHSYPTCPTKTPCSVSMPVKTSPSCPTPNSCPPCEPCPTCSPPVSCPGCPNCPDCLVASCPPLQTCPTPSFNASSCPTMLHYPPFPAYSPTPTCPPPQTCSTPVQPPLVCPPCVGCPAEEVNIPGVVNNVHLTSCNVLTWDLPRDGGKCISEYRVRIFNGKTYASSTERRVFRAHTRNITLTGIPIHGTTSIVIRAKNNVGFSSSWSSPFSITLGM